MTLLAGIGRSALERLRDGVPRYADELEPGMHVQLDDGRWAVVCGPVDELPLGKISAPVVTAYGLAAEVACQVDPERLVVGWFVRVATRTPEEQRAYVAAVEQAAAEMEGTE